LMATVACPGCGLPRVESDMEAKPCPVCDAVPVALGNSHPAAKKPAEPDPIAGLPSDVSELYGSPVPVPARAYKRPTSSGSRLFAVGAVMFFAGTLVGIGGVLGWQAIDWSAFKNNEPEVVANSDETNPLVSPPAKTAPEPPAIAPMPREVGTLPAPVKPNPEPEPKQPPPPPGRVTTVELNQPEIAYSLPFPMKKGEHVVLKGKVKVLRVTGLDAGAILDATALEVTTVTVSGKIDGGSTLKLNAPNGLITFTAKVDGKSKVNIHAPGGDVKFSMTTVGNREGSKIDNGSVVNITARVVEFKGDITGTDTKVSITLTRNAWLKIASVNGKATVEYKSQVAGWSPPDVIVGTVAPTARFRKIGDE
ncbi:MAG: hypothetical protein L0241_26230, partial [Planctomycetia bacterium]|nr:hypothetical protein [Planctomycetia bacterium]